MVISCCWCRGSKKPHLDFEKPIGVDGRTGQSVHKGQIHHGREMVSTLFQMRGAKMLFSTIPTDWLAACLCIALLGVDLP